MDAMGTSIIDWWVDPFVSNTFMRTALWAGLLTVLSTSLVGTWVVLRGMAFLGDALAHGVLPGVAIAFVLGIDPAIGAAVAAIFMVTGLHLLDRRQSLPQETSVGVLFVGFLALAVVVMSSNSGSYAGDLHRFLFGSITGIDSGDLLRLAMAGLAAVIGVVVFHRAFLMMTFDPLQAQLLGMRPKLARFILLLLLAQSIVAAIETVGNLLALAFLIGPPATASLLVRRVSSIMMVAVAVGSVSVVLGLLISFHRDTAAGATMALTAVSMFVVVTFVKSMGTLLRSSVSRSQRFA